jgi:hypothetical protein
MDISPTTSDYAGVAQIAVQSQMLNAMKVQGEALNKMIVKSGSVNSASQGKHVDIWA